MEHALTGAAAPGRRWRFIVVLMAAFAAALIASFGRVALLLDEQIQDQFTRLLPDQSAPPGVVLVDIDERSVSEFGPWPWPRPVMARIMQALQDRGVRLQVWDVFFADSSSGDEALQALLASADGAGVTLAQVPVIDPLVHAPPKEGRLLAQRGAPSICSIHRPIIGYLGVASSLSPRSVGHIASTPEADGRLRRVPAVLCEGGRRFPQLAVSAAAALEKSATWAISAGEFPFGPSAWLTRGSLRFPLDAEGFIRVPYNRPHGTWPAISVASLFDGAADTLPLKGAVVLVGGTAIGVGDTASTPRHPRAPGVSVHAELLGAAFDGAWLIPFRFRAVGSFLLVLAVGLLLLPLFSGRSRLGLWVIGLLLALLVPVGMVALGRIFGVLLPFVPPLVGLFGQVIGFVLVDSIQDRRRARQLAAHLESFLPRALARDISTQNPSGESLGKACHGVLVALRIVGMERWAASVDSLQGLALAHAVSTLSERHASARGGALEHVQGETYLLAWPVLDAGAVHSALAVTRAVLRQLDDLLPLNESPRFPLSARASVESGAFLLGVAGSRASRRPLLLGPAADAVRAMLPLCDELASPILVGASVASLAPSGSLEPVGTFLLADQVRPTQLFRSDV